MYCLIHLTYITTWGGARHSATNIVLNDNYASSGGTASSGVGASSKAVYDAYSTLLNKFKSYQTTPTWVDTSAELDALSYDDASFHWGYGLISNIAYFSVSIGWITLQFKIGVNLLQTRYKYGSNAWTSWKDV